MSEKFAYELGSSNPVRAYSSFSGLDTKFQALVNGKFETVGLVQTISVKRNMRNGKLRGDISFLILDRELIPRTKTFRLFCSNEHDQTAEYLFENFKFLEETWGVAVDDIVIETRIRFKARSRKGWGPSTQ